MNGLRSIYRQVRWQTFWNSFQLPEVDLAELVRNPQLDEPVITENLDLSPYGGPTEHNDALPLFALVRSLKPRIVLELGTGYGATVANICALSEARVFTVNALPEQIEGRHITFILSKDEIGEVYRKYGFAERVVQIYANTRDLNFADYLSRESVDLAVVDACHDADFVVSDFISILPMLHQHSVVLFHDVHPSLRAHLVDSYVGCMYLRKLGFDIYYLKGTWWGVWRAERSTTKMDRQQRVLNVIDRFVVRTMRRTVAQDALSFRHLARLYLPRPVTGVST